MLDTEKSALSRDGVVSPHPPVPAVVAAVTSAPAAVPLPPMRPAKNLSDAWLLCFPLGLLGAHNYYLRRYGFGILYTFTLGLFGVGMLVDMCRMPVLVKRANARIQTPERPRQKHLDEAYVLWFPFGLLGFHHFYLRRWPWGMAYLFSFGLLGIGWLIDCCRMPILVREANQKLQQRQQQQQDTAHAHEDPEQRPVVRLKSLSDAYVLTLSPVTGLLGVQHYYLGRIGFGLLYTFTLGLLGTGWLADVFRMKYVVERVNKQKLEGKNRLKHLDDAYVCALVFGLLGTHNYYLGRYCWGVLYTCTLGLLGIGWLTDLVRMKCLVRRINEQILLQQAARWEVTPATPGALTPPGVGVMTEGSFINSAAAAVSQPPSYGTPSEQLPSYMIQADQPPSYIDVTSGNMPTYVAGSYPPVPGMPMPPPGVPVPPPGMPMPPSGPSEFPPHIPVSGSTWPQPGMAPMNLTTAIPGALPNSPAYDNARNSSKDEKNVK